MLTEALPMFFTQSEFAEPVVVNGIQVSAIFDDGYAQGGVGVVGMGSSEPCLTMATADVPASPVGKSVVARGASYQVAAHEPDGTGVSKVLLEKLA